MATLEMSIKLLKQKIELQEKDLVHRARQIPQEMIKSASAAILPTVLSQISLSGILKIVKLAPLTKSLFSIFRKKTGI